MTHDEKISKRQGKTEGRLAAQVGARASIPLEPKEPRTKFQEPNSKNHIRLEFAFLVLGICFPKPLDSNRH